MGTNTISLIISFIAVAISITSWFVGHYLSRKRDFENKRKEIRINFLINAWQSLEFTTKRKFKDDAGYELIEKSIANIQLFGNQKQRKMARDLVKEIHKGQGYTLPLLEQLRNDLREELGLERAEENFLFVRYGEKEMAATRNEKDTSSDI